MRKKETPAPYCHGEPMGAMYRYRAQDGVVYREWICLFCTNTTHLPLYVGDEE